MMKHSRFILALGFAGSVSGALAQNPNPNSTLSNLIQSEMDAEHFPGVSTIIVKNGKIVWVESYGFADVENQVPVEDTTAFLLASVSKVFTGTAAMQAFEDGTVNLDSPINTYLPWPIAIPGYENEPITMRQLMTHTSSINDGVVMDVYYDYPDPSISLADCIERYFTTSGADYDAVDNFLNAAPGTVYNYSNIGTALNGFIVETATGIPFDTFCESNIFEPLCMEKTGWHFADFDSADVARPYAYQNGNYVSYPHYGFADYPDGQLRSNVMDLGNFMIAYLNEGTFGSNTILSANAVSEMWTLQVPSLDATQGLNWYQEELFHDNGSSMLWGHNGGEDGVTTDLYVDPANEIGICVLTNGEGDALTICDALYNYALSLNSSNFITPFCLTSNTLNEFNQEKPTIIKVTDLLGRTIAPDSHTPRIVFYSNGKIEKVMGVNF